MICNQFYKKLRYALHPIIFFYKKLILFHTIIGITKMVANSYILEMVCSIIFTTCSLICVYLMNSYKNSKNDKILEDMILYIEGINKEIHTNHKMYLDKIKNVENILNELIIKTNTHRRHIDGLYDEIKILDNDLLGTLSLKVLSGELLQNDHYKEINELKERVTNVETTANDSIQILAEPILHFAEIEPRIKDILNSFIH